MTQGRRQNAAELQGVEIVRGQRVPLAPGKVDPKRSHVTTEQESGGHNCTFQRDITQFIASTPLLLTSN